MRFSRPCGSFALAFLLGSGGSVIAQPSGQSLPLLTRAEQIRKLPPEESERSYPVHLEGVVTYIDPNNPILSIIIIQDSTGGITVAPRVNQSWPRVGEKLIVDGVTKPGISQAFVINAMLQQLGNWPLPDPSRKSFGELDTGVEEGNWVQLQGTVRSMGDMGGRLELEILCEGRRAPLLVQSYAQNDPKLARLLDGTVRVSGISMLTRDRAKRFIKHVLLVSSLADVFVEQEGPSNLFDGSLFVIADVPTAAPPGRRLRVQGVVVERTRTGWLKIKDETGDISTKTRPSVLIRTGDRVEVAGYPSLDKSLGILEDALVRVLGKLAPGGRSDETNARPVVKPEAYVPMIVEANKVRLLSLEDAQAGHPVRVRGVVTYCDEEGGDLFVQDDTAGVGVSFEESHLPLKAGQEVELEGNSSPGMFAPMVRSAGLKILEPIRFPTPKPLLPQQMNTGKEDGQWVEVEGVVRSSTRTGRHVILEIAASGARFKAHLLDSGDQGFDVKIVDATVRLQGVCSTLSVKRQAVGFKLLIPGRDQVIIMEQPPSDPFSIPSRPLGALLQFAAQDVEGHRVKVEGVVTCQRSGEFLVIQDTKEGLYLQTSQTNDVNLGDRVEVLGFPFSDERGTILQDAIYRRTASGTVPTPLRVTALSGEFNALLVQIKGRVLDHVPQPRQNCLVLQAGPSVFYARLARDAPVSFLESYRKGSVLQVTGVCFMDQGKAQMPQGFSILVPSPGDLTLLQGPPRWTPKHTSLAAGIMAGLILASAAWVSSLKTRVRSQTDLIRQRVEKEAALERRYRELVQDAHDLIYTHDLKGDLTSVNRAGEKILGYSQEEGLRLNMKQLVAPEHHPTFDRCLAATLEGHPPAAFEIDVLSKMGRPITLEVGTRPIYRAGILVEVQGIARDITERKHSEAQRLATERNLQESQKLESLGVMAGGIAHDFNNLLTAILGNASLARMGLSPGSPAQASLIEIEKTSLQAADLCKQMLVFSGRNRVALQRVNLSTLINEMRHLLQISVHKKIAIHFDLAKELCAVDADPAQIRQIALNLVINGSEAIGDQPGTIRVSTGIVRIDEMVQSAEYVSQNLTPGEYAYLEVADTGCGMDPETKARIFEPFFTTKFTGRGLGLAAVLGIVRGHKGGFKVSTEKGRGSTLTLLLPCSAKAVDLSTLRPVREQEWRGEGTVLVVDDELGVRKVAERLLESFGFKVLLAEDGFAALEVFEAHPDEIALVLLDLTMPRLNGQEVLRRIKAVRPDVKVILMSGYTEEDVAGRFSADELSGVLEKPFKLADLRRKVRMALERGPARS